MLSGKYDRKERKTKYRNPRKIRLLSEDVVSKIAAGEVIERPASVVKELIENSIDAGATRIIVELKRGGIEYISVKDNGHGIPKKDLPLAVERHATSKIEKFSDLFSLQTLGFRGEALATICAVGDVKIISKTPDSDTGYYIVVKNGIISESGETAFENGTCVILHKIFSNTPVRKKFLKSESTELSHSTDVIINYALSHPDIRFILRNNGKELIRTAPTGNTLDIIADIFGIETAKKIIYNKVSDKDIQLEIFLGLPETAITTRQRQFFFVNNRAVRSSLLLHAVSEGYAPYLPSGYHPFGVFKLFLPPQKIDVNIHPTKREVKFSSQETVHRALKNAVNQCFKKKIPVYQMKIKKSIGQDELQKESWRISPETDTRKKEKGKSIPLKYHYNTQENLQSYLSESQGKIDISSNRNIKKPEKLVKSLVDKEGEESYVKSENTELIYIGQLKNTYLLFEAEDGLLLMDQHVASERIYYEYFKKKYRERNIEKQQLFEGIILELSASESTILDNLISYLDKIGIEIEKFGENAYLITSLPALPHGGVLDFEAKAIIQDIISMGKSGTLEEKIDNFIKIIACRSAIKAGKKLTIPEVHQLLQSLNTVENPANCPHGRPSFIKITYSDIEKSFRRRK